MRVRKYLCVFAVLCFLTGCGVTDREDLKPPDLTISAGGQDLSYTLGTFTWTENKRSVASESLTPPDLVDVTNEVEEGTTVSIDFSKEPDVLKVGVWEDDDEVLKQIAGNTITLPDEKGDFLYVIRAEWSEGDALYALSIKTVGARP
ncbi:hypothetical protein AF331_19615 [Rossellomorea marisflavi]|jgi:hypothetical protein|uniref:Lipoprotein n=1 Tax=Rossellomorea marisflavi TaxID=189381 RepID=A0A0M0G0D8_9BACI|nr:hypothetical protein AF331_19615 [Rossellomorea marisflavi]